MKILEFIFSGFWVFLGSISIIAIIADLLLKSWSRFMRMLMVRKHGWPPSYLDADGDQIENGND